MLPLRASSVAEQGDCLDRRNFFQDFEDIEHLWGVPHSQPFLNGLSFNSGTISYSTLPQQDSSRTSSSLAPGNRCVLLKLKTKTRRGMTIELRTTVCETFQHGQRASQVITKLQQCLQHPQTCLTTEIRNVVRKLHLGSTELIFYSLKTEFGKYACETMWEVLIPENVLAGKAVLGEEKFGDFIKADHRVLNEGCNSRNNWHNILSLNGSNFIRAELKLLTKRDRV